MAEDNDSFKFWRSYYDALRFLETDRQRSEFVMGLCAYVFDGIEPNFSDEVTEFGFRLVRKSAEESMLISRRARESGSRGGRPTKKRGAKRGAKSTPESSAESVAKRSVACGSSATANAVATPAGAPTAPADAGPVAPARAPGREPWDVPDGEYPTPPDV